MKATYDPEVKAAYVYLRDDEKPAQIMKTKPCGVHGGVEVLVDYDGETVHGIELLGVYPRQAFRLARVAAEVGVCARLDDIYAVLAGATGFLATGVKFGPSEFRLAKR